MISDEEILTFVCLRKHFLKDKKYNLSLLRQMMVMKEVDFFLNEQDGSHDSAKYNIEINLHNIILWKYDILLKQFVAFGIKYSDKVKWFYAQQQHLFDLKKRLTPFIFQGNISLFYESICQIGQGASCQVYKVRNILTQEQFASKCIIREYIYQKKNDLDRYNRMILEIQMMSSFNHSNIVRFEEVYEGANSYYLIMELLTGMSLQTYIKKHQQDLDYEVIKQIIFQIIEVLAYLETKKVIHRDLKPDNIVFKNDGTIFDLKVIDFGLAIYQYTKNLGLCGTPGYIAPEMFFIDDNFPYLTDCKSDVFSAGAILYKMVAKRSLFIGKSSNDVLEKNRICSFDLQLINQFQVPKDLYNLIESMLEVDPKKRISALDALKHPFFKQKSCSKLQNIDKLDESKIYQVSQENSNISLPQFQTSKQQLISREQTVSLEVRRLINGQLDNIGKLQPYFPSFSNQTSFESWNSGLSRIYFQNSDHIIEDNLDEWSKEPGVEKQKYNNFA